MAILESAAYQHRSAQAGQPKGDVLTRGRASFTSPINRSASSENYTPTGLRLQQEQEQMLANGEVPSSAVPPPKVRVPYVQCVQCIQCIQYVQCIHGMIAMITVIAVIEFVMDVTSYMLYILNY